MTCTVYARNAGLKPVGGSGMRLVSEYCSGGAGLKGDASQLSRSGMRKYRSGSPIDEDTQGRQEALLRKVDGGYSRLRPHQANDSVMHNERI